MAVILRASRSLTTTASVRPAQETTPGEPKPLYGTVQSHRSYVLLHSAEPPSSFPPRITSSIHRGLQLRASQWGGLVNFLWSEHRQPLHSVESGRASATAFSSLGGRLEIQDINFENLDEVATRLRRHAEGSVIGDLPDDEVHLYVCTHGARDCRCGTIGGEVVEALRREVAQRVRHDPGGPASRVRVGELGHVGGHQYAANLLVFPHGEWFGRLKPVDVSAILSTVLATTFRPQPPSAPPLLPRHWRGRMSLSKNEQVELYETHNSTLQ